MQIAKPLAKLLHFLKRGKARRHKLLRNRKSCKKRNLSIKIFFLDFFVELALLAKSKTTNCALILRITTIIPRFSCPFKCRRYILVESTKYGDWYLWILLFGYTNSRQCEIGGCWFINSRWQRGQKHAIIYKTIK